MHYTAVVRGCRLQTAGDVTGDDVVDQLLHAAVR